MTVLFSSLTDDAEKENIPVSQGGPNTQREGHTTPGESCKGKLTAFKNNLTLAH